jgi:hypothetical protein
MSEARRRFFLVATLGLLSVAAAVAFGIRHRLAKEVATALEAGPANARPLSFGRVAAAPLATRRWGTGEIVALAATPATTFLAGSSGVTEAARDDDAGLPTLRASALATWRGEPVVALEAGGLYRRRGGEWEEARTGWGTLHVRALVETEAGELLVGAREGLFRTAYGDPALTRLDARPVRAIVATRGAVLAGGEEGVRRIAGTLATAIEAPEAWTEALGVVGDRLYAATPAGLASGPLTGPLAPVAGGEDIALGVADGEAFWGAAWPRTESIRRFSAAGLREERLGSPVLRVMAAGGTLYADTEAGLFRRDATGWILARPRPEALPPGSAHIGALALFAGRVVAGSFDGGLAVSGDERGEGGWRAVPGSSAWAVNALLPAGGELFVASLRGVARYDGRALRAVEGPGAAFALAQGKGGVAIGYAQGLQLPGARLVSAFHGLPGNQVLALLSDDDLYVGTPSGLGAMRQERVAWRVAAGESRLPHPWVTALLRDEDALLVGTYGGGITRRRAAAEPRGPRVAFADGARYEPFAETEGLKINPGCLVRAGGRVYAGTDGRGLYRLSRDGAVFEPLALRLPSPRVTALLATDDVLFVGTDEGLARFALAEVR